MCRSGGGSFPDARKRSTVRRPHAKRSAIVAMVKSGSTAGALMVRDMPTSKVRGADWRVNQ